MNELKLTGGARIGMANASFPLATLKVNKDRLELNVLLFGNLTFQSSDIISIEPYTPFLRQGIKINHTVSNYKEQVIFSTSQNPELVVQQIKDTGFLNNENQINQKINRTILDKQAKGSGSTTYYIWAISLIFNFIFAFWIWQMIMEGSITL